MNLYLFPESAIENNGYGIVVNKDYETLFPEKSDCIVWYAKNSKYNLKYKPTDYILKRPGLINIKRFKNIFLNKPGVEVTMKELSFLKNQKFDYIFCGDVCFYRAIRKLFSNNHITVRFHNCFSRILYRKKLLNISLGFKFNLNLYSISKLEQEIFLDRYTEKIFISEEDKHFYELMTGYNDGKIWPIKVNREKKYKNRVAIKFFDKIVWFGGVEAHKERSLNWFIKSVFPKIKNEINNIEFHLWGQNTQRYNKPKEKIYGHGVYTGESLPLKHSALFINPDIIGGGVKIKLKTYFEEEVVFISTPYGYEGYDRNFIDNKYCFVVESDKWVEQIIAILKG
jgi:hypothetical protein